MNLDGYALPVKKLKGTEPVETLDLSGKYIGVASAVVIASLISVNGGLTVANLLGNQLNAESAKMLAEVAKQKGISLCGIRRDQTTADFSDQDLKLPDAILLASDMSQASVTGALTRLDVRSNFSVRSNNITGDGAVQLSATVLGNFKIEMFSGIPIKEIRANSLTELDLKGKGVGVVGGMVVAGLIPIMGSLTALDLSSNDLADEGISAVCEAIQSNEDTKLASLNFSDNGIGPVGANAVAAMVVVTGSLTKMRYVTFRSAPSSHILPLTLPTALCNLTTRPLLPSVCVQP